ncbi:MAG: flagellar biosynthetic protein FliR [Desulfobacca sp.]|nr:flagellar biosynthetic protein FliR [Desulfobacca sp.]
MTGSQVAWLLANFQSFVLVLMRVSVFLFFLPIWNSRMIPTTIKVGTILVISLLLTPVVQGYLPSFPASIWAGGGILFTELMLGLTFSLIVSFVFEGIKMAGGLVGIQMGFGMVTLIDPQAGGQTPLLADFLYLAALVLFLIINGHHLILRALVDSFVQIPMGAQLDGFLKLPQAIIHLGSQMFVLAVKLLAPIMVALFLIQVALGLVAKTVPQVQILFISFPLTIGLGLLFLSITLPLLTPYLVSQFQGLGSILNRVMVTING